MRADSYLTVNGFVESRTRAARLISEGKILIDGKRIEKPAEEIFDREHEVVITEADAYVGRGGLKLEAALGSFNIDVKGKRCIDVGASTGGFTDCLLQNGAETVYAVDSGRGQLHQKLLNDPRVVNIEGYNARELSSDELGTFDVAVMDVSFISQTLIHPALSTVLREGAVFISLIKPQFEAGRSALGKNGIVKNKKDREAAIIKVVESALVCGFELSGLLNSPITGGDGNREYLALFIRKKDMSPKSTVIDRKRIASVAEK